MKQTELEAKITTMRSRIADLKHALPTVLANNDTRALSGLTHDLRLRTQELEALEAALKRLKIEAREETS